MGIADPMNLVQTFANLATPIILVLLLVFLLLIGVLVVRARHERRRLQDFLLNAVRALPHHADLNRSRAIEDQIDAFIHDLDDLSRNAAEQFDDARREMLRSRLLTKDESRPYLRSMHFEVWYNAWRTLIEAFPILGILGTIAAIAASLHHGTGAVDPTTADAADAAGESMRVMTSVLANFGNAIYSTGAGLLSALILMTINAFVEPGFDRLVEQKRQVREVIRVVKNHLTLGRATRD